MYKVLIIDDEEPVRRALKRLGKWKELGVEHIYESIDGEKGLVLLKEQQPDIIFVDMKMPIMNGGEFLEIASRERPNAIYIVISGFSDFAYTRQAIKSNVLDYLLKPISGEDLERILKKAVDRLILNQNEEKKDLEKSIATNMMMPLLKEKFFNDLIINGSNSILLRDYEKKLNFSGSDTFYGAVVLCVLNFEKICLKRFSGDSYAFFFSMINILNELGNEDFQCFSMKNMQGSHEIIIVLEDKNRHYPLTNKKLAYEFLIKAIDKLQILFDINSIAVIGTFYAGISQLNKSYEGIESALKRVNLLNYSEVVFVEQELNELKDLYSIRDKKLSILNAVSSCNVNYADQVITDYFSDIVKAGKFNLELSKRIMMEFSDIVINISRDLGISENESIINSLRDIAMSATLKNIEKLSEYLRSILRKLIEIINLKKTNVDNFAINNIKKYIDENFSEEIKLSKFSEKFYISKEHLCRIFKEEFGYGIYEYTLKVRMEKAKELLENPSIQIQLVAEMLGYSNSNYFSRAFKKYYGHSPKKIK